MRVPHDRPLHVAERHLFGRFLLDVEVAHRRLAHRRLDALNLVLRIDGGLDAIFPSMVIETTCIFSGMTTLPSRPISICSHRQMAFGLAPGRRAALMKPGGFNHRSS